SVLQTWLYSDENRCGIAEYADQPIQNALRRRSPRPSQGRGEGEGLHYCPRGVVTSVPAGGLNSNGDGAIGARVWFEYVVTIRSPFGNSMSVPSTRNSLLIRRSSF